MAGTVRGAVQLSPRHIEIQEFPRPAIGPDGGVVQIEADGVCGSGVEQDTGVLGNREFPARRRLAPRRNRSVRMCLLRPGNRHPNG